MRDSIKPVGPPLDDPQNEDLFAFLNALSVDYERGAESTGFDKDSPGAQLLLDSDRTDPLASSTPSVFTARKRGQSQAER